MSTTTTRLTQDEVISELCSLLGVVYHRIGNYDEPCDGICHECELKRAMLPVWDDFRHHPAVLEFIRASVMEKLNREYPKEPKV